MAFAIDFIPEATQELHAVRKYDQARIVDAIQNHLRNNPTQTSKSRIKKLEGFDGYRLRVDEFRVYYTANSASGMVAGD